MRECDVSGHGCISGLLVEDHFGVWVSPIGDGGIVLAAVKADALAGGLRRALEALSLEYADASGAVTCRGQGEPK